jgi:hypothetical protein
MYRWFQRRLKELKANVVDDAARLAKAFLGLWQHPLGIIGAAVLLFAIGAFVSWILDTGGTGFTESATAQSTDRQRTLWDWLDLLLIPLVLGVGAFVFNIALQRRQTQLAKAENETDRKIGRERNREETLRHYLDVMQRLMLEVGMNGLPRLDPRLSDIARARTLAVIRALAGSSSRIDQVLVFLRESHLLDVTNVHKNTKLRELTVSLARADFRSVDLRGVNFDSVNLEAANFDKANLRGASFWSANLQRAKMINTDLQGADLVNADLRGGFFDRRDPTKLHALDR